MRSDLVYNGVRCLSCGELIESRLRSERSSCRCANGTTVDGGLKIPGYSGADIDLIQPVPVHLWDDYATVREYGFILRAMRKGKLTVLRIKEIGDAWLERAISWLLNNITSRREKVLLMLIREQQYRRENEE
jgi:hypothetical protein